MDIMKATESILCGFLSEVPGAAGHVQDPEDPSEVCSVPQGPHPPVSG